jgi:DNA segregation ATPase FtsK/SpoIIIE-like protein
VASENDSRAILDVRGAEMLTGMGDALFSSAEIARPHRLKTPFVSDDEIEKIVNSLKNIN